ncbi:unnamed protein product [Pelagomonas calceolata]|uniref:Uncharacterized protein n=1 Tax=Pelagomonas calceolata TaxID=35677 RepID=A0A8J2SFR3_9STRA|nr:unnamed protein product [Pelagomonas calceolata]
MYAALRGNPEVAKILLSAGADANALIPIENPDDERTWSALVMAVFVDQRYASGSYAIIEMLLKAGADANPPKWGRKTVMQMAINYNRRRIWPLLLRAGSILPIHPYGENSYYDETHRTDPYLLKIDAAGGFKAYEKAHLTQLLAIFAPKFTHLVPPELVARFLEFSFHVGFY